MSKVLYRQPAEWTPHRAVWMAWPSHADLWGDNLKSAQREFVDLCHAITNVATAPTQDRGENLEVLVPSVHQKAEAELQLKGLPVRFHLIPFGDIWLRDTAPIFVKNQIGETLASSFKFNGWGQKYELPYDNEVAERVATASGFKVIPWNFILEGGSIDVDGLGTGLTTEQCLLNPNRNKNWSKADVEEKLKESLGIEKLIWIKEGLLNDHTDGHIDTIARFVSPGKVVCMQASDSQDPNAKVLDQIAAELSLQTDILGKRLEVIRVPSPGLILDDEGKVMPASYVNFYIGNATVVVPTYGSSYDAEAVAAIAKLFPDKKTFGCSARFILSGGGSFHCITQQEPV